MRQQVLWVLLALTSGATYAQTYDVQIGAFRNPNPGLSVPSDIGELRSSTGSDGLTRFVVGPYASKSDAKDARDRLRSAGFTGAFVVAATQAVTQSDQASSWMEVERRTTDATTATEASLESMDDGEGERVVLDGKLHRKVGDRFIPIKR